MDTEPTSRERLRYDAATRAREFEIDLFWKRSLFFWGFQGVAFIALAAVHGRSLSLAVVVASFGAMCAWVWTLANRGSKYWYESWEKKLHSAEITLTGPLHSAVEDPKDPGDWLSGERYSVSRLAIGLSDYAVVFWLAALGYEISTPLCLWLPPILGYIMAVLFAAGSVVYAVELRKACVKHDDPPAPDA
jgi:hypothetical protein